MTVTDTPTVAVSVDPELELLETIVARMEQLDEPARRRVLDFATNRYRPTTARRSRATAK